MASAVWFFLELAADCIKAESSREPKTRIFLCYLCFLL